MSTRVLITDEDALTCRLFVKVLGGEGYQCGLGADSSSLRIGIYCAEK